MHFHISFLFAQAVLLLALIGQGLSKPPSHVPPGTLYPIRLHNHETAPSLHRREPRKVELSQLDLQTQSQLIHGGQTAAGDLLLANMTLYAPNGLQMILMEEFDHLTSAVDCHGDDGTMSLTFNSKHAFEYALKTWRYINLHDDDRFILIANHKGCGPDDERQPYLYAPSLSPVHPPTPKRKPP